MNPSSQANQTVSASQSEATAVTPPTVAATLGFPNHREELSPSPTGWQSIGATAQNQSSTEKVSRETSN